MTEQEIAAALLQHRPSHLRLYGLYPDQFEWFGGSEVPILADQRHVVPQNVYAFLSLESRSLADWIAIYTTREAAYADLASAYRLAYPA